MRRGEGGDLRSRVWRGQETGHSTGSGAVWRPATALAGCARSGDRLEHWLRGTAISTSGAKAALNLNSAVEVASIARKEAHPVFPYAHHPAAVLPPSPDFEFHPPNRTLVYTPRNPHKQLLHSIFQLTITPKKVHCRGLYI
jgi:hypothetical protein